MLIYTRARKDGSMASGRVLGILVTKCRTCPRVALISDQLTSADCAKSVNGPAPLLHREHVYEGTCDCRDTGHGYSNPSQRHGCPLRTSKERARL